MTAALPAHVVAVLRAPAARPVLARALRRVHASGGASALVVVGPGVPAPEGVALEPAGRALVGVAPLEHVRDIAAARSADAAAQLGAELPQGGGWCLYLDAGLRCAVVPVPPSSSSTPAPWGDA